MEILSVESIQLPRINDKFYRNFALKDSYRTKKENLTRLIKANTIDAPKIPPPYTVVISIGTHYDIDSCLKPLMDSMQDAKVIDNDKNIHKLIIDKIPVKRNVPNWIIVELFTKGKENE